MTIVERGAGTPVVLVPSLQGRWEYLSRAVDALARSHRVITFSLDDDTTDLDGFARQIARALDDRGLARAAICGISFGGRVALRFAASQPERVDALILVSVPGPGWHLKPLHRWCAHHPLISAPVVVPAMLARLRSEVAAAIPEARHRRIFMRQQLGRLVTAPLSPTGMAARALLIDHAPVDADCAGICAPTLIISGEPALDHVVPADGTRQYAALIAGARGVTLERTGHLGCITRPDAFAGRVREFLYRDSP